MSERFNPIPQTDIDLPFSADIKERVMREYSIFPSFTMRAIIPNLDTDAVKQHFGKENLEEALHYCFRLQNFLRGVCVGDLTTSEQEPIKDHAHGISQELDPDESLKLFQYLRETNNFRRTRLSNPIALSEMLSKIISDRSAATQEVKLNGTQIKQIYEGRFTETTDQVFTRYDIDRRTVHRYSYPGVNYSMINIAAQWDQLNMQQTLNARYFRVWLIENLTADTLKLLNSR